LFRISPYFSQISHHSSYAPKNGSHNDWNDWLKAALEEAVSQVLRNLGGPEKPILEYHRFDGHETPMVNVVAFRLP
jgi:hypothetical protein